MNLPESSKAQNQTATREELGDVQMVIVEEYSKDSLQDVPSQEILLTGGLVEGVETRTEVSIDMGKQVVDVEESQCDTMKVGSFCSERSVR